MTESPRNSDHSAFLVKMLARGWLTGRKKDAGHPRFQILTRDTRARPVATVTAAQVPGPIVFEPVASPEATNVTAGKAEVGSLGEGGEILANTPVVAGKEPRFRIRKFADLRSTRFVSLRRYVQNRDIPHNDYHMPGFSPFGTRAERLEARRQARLKAIDDTKEERNVRFAYGIEEVWQRVGEGRRGFIRQGSRAGIGRIHFAIENTADGRYIMTDEEVNRVPIIAEGRYKNGYAPLFLKEQQEILMETSLKQWITERDSTRHRKRKGMNASAGDVVDYKRLSELVGLLNSSRTEDMFVPDTPFSKLNAASKNALRTIWGLYAVSSETFEVKNKRQATKRELASMYASAEHIASSIAIGHIQLGIPFIGHLQYGEVGKTDEFLFQFNLFDVKEVPDPEIQGEFLPTLVMKDEAFTSFEAVVNNTYEILGDLPILERVDEKATGCPALYAKGQGTITPAERGAQERVKHVVSELCQWSYAVATELSEDYLKAPGSVAAAKAASRRN